MIVSISEEKGYAIIKVKEYLGPDAFAKFRAAIEGAKYDGTRRLNYATVDKVTTIIQRLRESDFDVELAPEMADRLKSHTAQMWVDLQSAQDRLTTIEEALAQKGLKLFPFQRSGVQWLATRMGALLADEMGLGKTVQAVVALPANAPVLIVAPAVAKGVWRREFKKWGRGGMHVDVLEGRDSFRWPKPGEAVIVNYDILPECHTLKKQLVKGKWKMVKACDKTCEGCLHFLSECAPGTVIIADEGHALKNPKAQRTIKFRALGNAVRSNGGRTWILTATPMLNKPPELWSVYQCAGIAQEAFGNWSGFMNVFQGRPGTWGGFEWGTPLAEAGERIRRVCLRRLRMEVLPELPTKTWREIEVEVDRKTLKKCDEVLEEYGGIDAVLELVEAGSLDFETLSATRRALAVAKIPALLSLIEDYEEQEEPVVVFSAHLAVCEELSKREGWAVISGATSPEERTRIEEEFQRKDEDGNYIGKLRGVVCTIKAGGVAITLTRAHHAIFTDLEWTPALNAQAEDRICRIGQDRGCIITRLIANHILDERIAALLMQKQILIAGSVDAARVIETQVNLPTDEDFAATIRKAEEEIKKAEEATAAPKPAKPPKPSNHKAPRNARERWACQALITLARLDPDKAGAKNDVGFNGTDSGFGHSLAEQVKKHGGLSDKQYPLAIQMCRKYWRQVGECPEVEE